MALQHLRSSTANKRPTPAAMSDGQIALNSNTASPGLFFKDSAGALIKVGPVHVGTTAPNASPASGGQTGNTVGEQWLDTTGGTYVFKVWDGSSWRSETGTFVDVNGDTMTGALGIIAGSAATPGLFVSGDTNTGIYSPGADQLAISTNGTGALFIDASGNVGILDSSPQRDAGTTSLAIGDGSKASSIDFYGTVNNYAVYNGGSGQFAVYDLTNTTERITLTSDGKLGLGTSNAEGKLTINGSAAEPPSSGTTANSLLQITDSVLSNQINFGLHTVTGNYGGYIQVSDNNHAVNYGLHLQPKGGNVGIGTNSVGAKLHVFDGSSGGSAYAFANAIIEGSTYSYLDIKATSGCGINFGDAAAAQAGVLEYDHTSNFMRFVVNNGEAARIDSSRRLLVGTSSSASAGNSQYARLQVRGNSLNNSAIFSLQSTSAAASISSNSIVGTIEFADNTGNEFGRIQCVSDADAGSGDYPGRLTFSTTADGASTPTERLRITSDGKVGIGTSVPPANLTVANNGAEGFEFVPAISSNLNRLSNYNRSGSAYCAFRVDASQHEFHVNGSERARLDSSGRLLVGTSSALSTGSAANSLVQVVGRAAQSNDEGRLAIARGEAATKPLIKDNIIGRVFFTDNAGNEFATVGCYVDNTSGAGDYPGRLEFSTTADGASSPTPRVTIDSSGRLLVGTSSSSTNDTLVLQGGSSSSTGPCNLRLRRGSTPGSGDTLGGTISFENNSGNTGATIHAAADGAWGTNDYPGRLVFSTTADGSSSPTERMRITNNGQLRTLAAQTAFLLSSATSAGTSEALIEGKYSGTATGGGTTSFVVYTNGDVQNTNNAYGSLSDIKLKENIVDASSQWDDLKALQVRNYNFKEGQTHTQIGLVAQEVELVSPGLVSESPDRDEDGNDLGTVTKSVNYSVLYMKAVKALQEAMERIEQLEAKVAALEAA